MLQSTKMRQQLIILLTHVEKIRYYYLMDNRFLNREIEAYNTSIKNFTDSLPLTLQNSTNNSKSKFSMQSDQFYYKLLNDLSLKPLHEFHQGTILVDLQQRQDQLHQTLVYLLNEYK